MNNLIRSILKTAVYFLEQTDRVAGDVRDRVSDSVDRAADRVSDLRDQAEELYAGKDHTLRNVLTFAAVWALESGLRSCLPPRAVRKSATRSGKKFRTSAAGLWAATRP